MIPPRKVKFEAMKRERENMQFRIFLKNNAEEEALDAHFQELHKELFSAYDCSRCRNCCKELRGTFLLNEIPNVAEYIQMSKEKMIHLYLEKQEFEDSFITKHKPCDFLQKDGNCMLGECKPDNCKKYPYTDQPERLQSLLSVIDAVGICPVAYEIWERLKKIYGFKQY